MSKGKKTKKGKAKRKNIEKAFCSEVVKAVKKNKHFLFSNRDLFIHYYKEIRKSPANVVTYLDSISDKNRKAIGLYYFQPNEHETIRFFKSGNKIIRIDLMEKWVYPLTMVKKISLIRPTFEEVTFKQAKQNNTIDFQLVQWIAGNK